MGAKPIAIADPALLRVDAVRAMSFCNVDFPAFVRSVVVALRSLMIVSNLFADRDRQNGQKNKSDCKVVGSERSGGNRKKCEQDKNCDEQCQGQHITSPLLRRSKQPRVKPYPDVAHTQRREGAVATD